MISMYVQSLPTLDSGEGANGVVHTPPEIHIPPISVSPSGFGGRAIADVAAQQALPIGAAALLLQIRQFPFSAIPFIAKIDVGKIGDDGKWRIGAALQEGSTEFPRGYPPGPKGDGEEESRFKRAFTIALVSMFEYFVVFTVNGDNVTGYVDITDKVSVVSEFANGVTHHSIQVNDADLSAKFSSAKKLDDGVHQPATDWNDFDLYAAARSGPSPIPDPPAKDKSPEAEGTRKGKEAGEALKKKNGKAVGAKVGTFKNEKKKLTRTKRK